MVAGPLSGLLHLLQSALRPVQLAVRTIGALSDAALEQGSALEG